MAYNLTFQITAVDMRCVAACMYACYIGVFICGSLIFTVSNKLHREVLMNLHLFLFPVYR